MFMFFAKIIVEPVFVNRVKREIMSEIKFKKPRKKLGRKTTVEDSDDDRSDDESFKLVLLNIIY